MIFDVRRMEEMVYIVVPMQMITMAKKASRLYTSIW